MKYISEIELVSVQSIQAETNFGFEPDENRIVNSEDINVNINVFLFSFNFYLKTLRKY